ncbi:hypothetical protein MPSEU_000624300 [Mayamaea pseudoterrestris]|nr:hypothetical protein MPSEU_000624300 [Mayamaea pseudoterrestris]
MTSMTSILNRSSLFVNRLPSVALGRSDSKPTVLRLFTFCSQHSRSFFTDANRIKRDDPYAQLGLQWGDGSTLSDIKAAYRRKAALLHPDVNPSRQAQRDFQNVQRAYETLTKMHSKQISALASDVDSYFENMETAWRFGVWRKNDDIAVERTDVAGARKRRPIPPAVTSRRGSFAGAQLGHPQHRHAKRGEYLGSAANIKPSSSVGRGRSKWVTPKEFVPWNGTPTATKTQSTRATGATDCSRDFCNVSTEER